MKLMTKLLLSSVAWTCLEVVKDVSAMLFSTAGVAQKRVQRKGASYGRDLLAEEELEDRVAGAVANASKMVQGTSPPDSQGRQLNGRLN